MQNHDKIVLVTIQSLTDRGVWVTLSFSLCEEEYVAGEHYVHFADGFRCDIVPRDEDAAQAFQEDEAELRAQAAEEGEQFVCSWVGWIVEGVHKGFLLQRKSDRGVVLRRLEGCLGKDGHVVGIIWAATLGVTLLLEGDASVIKTPGWIATECCVS
jgi:hypothetical protein